MDALRALFSHLSNPLRMPMIISFVSFIFCLQKSLKWIAHELFETFHDAYIANDDMEMLDDVFEQLTIRQDKGDDEAAITDGPGGETVTNVGSWASGVVGRLRRVIVNQSSE
jgi:hypothetical protein